jgi:hypothetical protein
MKRIISLLLIICICISTAVLLVSCGKEEQHTHSFGEEWSKDNAYHWIECDGEDCTEVADKTPHKWDNGVVVEEATKTTKGLKTFTCTVCAHAKTQSFDYKPSTIVSDQEWEEAFYLGENYKIYCEQTFSESGTKKWTDKRAGDLLESIFESIPTIGERETVYNYAKIDGTLFLKYIPSYDETQEFEGYRIHTSEKEVDEELSEIVATYIPMSLRDYEDYTYNEANETYECAEGEFEGIAVTNIKLKFEDGKLISFRFTMETAGEIVTVSGTVSYGNAEVTLPSDEEIIEIVE